MRRVGRVSVWIASIAVIAAAAVALVSCGKTRQANVLMQQVGEWQVGVANSPDPAHVGDNTLTVVARDALGKPLRGSVDVVVSMAAMGTMPYMESRAKVKSAGPGVFRGVYGIPMGGEWDVIVRLRPDQGPVAEGRYRLSTSIQGVTLVGGTPGSSKPGTSANVMLGDSAAGAVMIDAARRQALGIRTEPAQLRDLSAHLRAPGRVAFDEAHLAEVALKFNGWVRGISVNATGQQVRRGQILFQVYSPELWAAQQEFLEATRAANADQANSALAGTSAELARASRERLKLWDLSSADIDEIARTGRPKEAFPIRSQVSGVVTEKSIVQGSAFQAGQVLFRIARLDPIWIIASVPQQDIALVRRGMQATIRDPYRATAVRIGLVSFIYPEIDSITRNAQVRIETRNGDGRLQPGTFVDVELATPPLKRLSVPESAVLPTGERFIVFVDLGDGRLVPREVRLGSRSGGYYEVLSGLLPGEIIVTSGNFLVASESKLRSAQQKW